MARPTIFKGINLSTSNLIETNLPIDSHHSLWKKIGDNLLYNYKNIKRSQYLDSEQKGKRGEKYFRDWLNSWLPTRIKATEGIIVAKEELPSTQRDVVLFDHFNTPIFSESISGEKNLLPIEGVLGLIEVNSGAAGITKIKKDIQKLAYISKLTQSGGPTQIMPILENNQTKILTIPRYSGKILKYIFAEDYEDSFESLGAQILQQNIQHGCDESVDAIFILEKGCIFHGNSKGIHTSRIQNKPDPTNLYTLEAEPWDVLLILTSLINQHLSFGSRGNVPNFEEYFGEGNEIRRKRILEKRKKISNDEYSTQKSRFLTVGQ